MSNLREKKAVQSKSLLIKTIGKVLMERGYSKLSINLISEESGVDKAFIYRHYGDFSGLLKSYVQKKDYWLRNLEELAKIKIGDQREFMKSLIVNQFNGIYSDEEQQQFLIWELADKEDFTTEVAIEREILADPLYQQTKDVFQKYRIDTNMIYAILMSSVYYLVLHKERSNFCTYDFTQKQDIQEFIKTVEWLIDLLFDKLETDNQLEQAAVRAHEKGVSPEDIVYITGLSINKVNALIHKF